MNSWSSCLESNAGRRRIWHDRLTLWHPEIVPVLADLAMDSSLTEDGCSHPDSCESHVEPRNGERAIQATAPLAKVVEMKQGHRIDLLARPKNDVKFENGDPLAKNSEPGQF